MTSVAAYLSRTEQSGSSRAVAGPILAIFNSIVAFVRVTGQAFTEARAMERAMGRKYPFLDG